MSAPPRASREVVGWRAFPSPGRGRGRGRDTHVSRFALTLYGSFNRYYEGGVSSVYLWDTDDGFAGVVLIKKCKAP